MSIAKNTFILAIIASLLIGFTGGVIYSNYNQAGAYDFGGSSAVVPAEAQAVFDGAFEAGATAASKAIYDDIQKNGGVPATSTSTPQALFNKVFEKAMAASTASPSSTSVGCDAIYSKDAKEVFNLSIDSYFVSSSWGIDPSENGVYSGGCEKYQGSAVISYMVYEYAISSPKYGAAKAGILVDMDIKLAGTFSWIEKDVLGRCHIRSKTINTLKHFAKLITSVDTYRDIEPCTVHGLPGHPYCGESYLGNITITKYLCSGSFSSSETYGFVDINSCPKCKKATSTPKPSSTSTSTSGYR